MSLDSYPPEELTEWFRPVAKVRAHAVGSSPPAPPAAPPVAVDAREASIDRRLGRRTALRRGVAIAAAGCAVVGIFAWLATSGESPAAATPGESATGVAAMPAPTVQPTETPQSAPAPSATAVAVALGTAGPAAAARHVAEQSARAPLRTPMTAVPGASDARPRSRVVQPLPTLPAPDQEKIRRELEPKVWGGEASNEEIRMLKAICSNAGDHACRDRASDMLKRREP